MIYDKACFMCSNYVMYTNLKKYIPSLEYVNARESNNTEFCNALPYDLDNGILFYHDECYYYAEEAVSKINKMTNKNIVFNLFFERNSYIANKSYKFLVV